jgi:CubicO group peptidase (beta-lactamase class C family)
MTSTAGLLSLEARVDQALAELVQPDAPGAAVGIIQNGRFIHRKAYGLADLEWATPLRPDSVFRICSLTKQFTAVAVMMLEERGALSVEDPLERHLPDWPARGRRITLRHLLDHTSGVWRHDSDQVERTLRPNPPVTDVLEMIKARDFEFEPGERYRYNNSGYLLLGAVIEAVSGMSYADFLRTAIFEPLGMGQTRLLTHEAITPLRARGYIKGRKRFHNARLDAMNWAWSAGALGSTLDDLALWDRAIRDHRLIRRETLERMLAPARLTGGGSFPYGFGWGLADYRGLRVFHHTGGISGFGCHMLHARDEDLTTIVLSNLYLFAFDRVTRGLLRAVKGWDATTEPLSEATRAQMAACAGRYENEDGPFVIEAGATHLATLGDDRLCERADPEVEYRFSEPRDGAFQRLDYVSPLWPVSTWRRANG